jgi:radical SAM superfamily enzyme YgiQ (UPF0313 family)
VRSKLDAMSALNAQVSATATVFGRDPEWVLSFDREGRLLTFVQGEELFKRALDSRVFRRDRRSGRRWELLPGRERREVFAMSRELAARTAAAPEAPAALRARLETEVLPWTVDRLAAEEGRFLAAYRPIAILPPDRYLAVVLQATEGCTWNRCTFCSFYQGRPFRLATPEEFGRHAAAVRELLGEDAGRRRSIFLADGNALAVGNRRLLPLLAIARESFPGREITGFVDVYSGLRHEPTDWRELASQGLTQVYVGMETGCDDLLREVDKPGSAAELGAFVRELKEAGLAVSLILMIGMGGRSFRERHRAGSLATLAALPLDRRDLLYLSPFVEEPGSVYVERRIAAGGEPLSAGEIEAETAAWTAALRARGLRVGRYDIREFIY